MYLKLKHRQIPVDITLTGERKPEDWPVNHPLRYVFTHTRSTETYLQCLSDLYAKIPEEDLSVMEFCGGVGLVAEAAWDRINPSQWLCVELDPECGPLFQSKRASYAEGNMFDPVWFEEDVDYDVYAVDAPTSTLDKMRREPERKKLFDNIFAKKPKYVMITDVEYWWIHLDNHWNLYKEDFARIGITMDSWTTRQERTKLLRDNYACLMDHYVKTTYGYRMIGEAHGGGAQYFLFEPV